MHVVLPEPRYTSGPHALSAGAAHQRGDKRCEEHEQSERNAIQQRPAPGKKLEQSIAHHVIPRSPLRIISHGEDGTMKPFTKAGICREGQIRRRQCRLLRCSDAPKKSQEQNGNLKTPQPAKNKLIQADKHISRRSLETFAESRNSAISRLRNCAVGAMAEGRPDVENQPKSRSARAKRQR